MATALDRRRCLTGLSGLGALWVAAAAWPKATGAATSLSAASSCCVAAWDSHDGQHWVGVVQAHPDATLSVVSAQALPTRAHGLTVEADGRVLVLARRPGEWLLRWDPQQKRPPQWHWLSGPRVLSGHALVHAQTAALLTVEQDGHSAEGWLVLRDPQSLAERAAWPTGGLDPHMALMDGAGHVLVANGGVPPAGLARQGLALSSSLVRLSVQDGKPAGRWTLGDRHLSLRHLARHASGRVGIALQAEHAQAGERMDAPLLALFDGETLQLAQAQAGLGGYGGDIAATEEGFVVSASRAAQAGAAAGALAHWTLAGRIRQLQAWPLAGAVGLDWAAGAQWRSPGALRLPPPLEVKAWDNHLSVLSGDAAPLPTSSGAVASV